jgi:class 3 adenylate cyclase
MSAGPAPAARDDAAARALAAAERAGYRLMLLGRSAALGLALVWTGYGAALSGNPLGPTLVSLSLAAGLVELASLGGPGERRWRRYGIVALDVATLVGAALFAPLMDGAEVPQHMVLRAYGMHLLWFAPVVSALALSPGLTAFAGAAAALGVWAVFLGVTADMPRPLSWGDLAPDATAADYVALLLDPAFVGRGNRVEESVALLAGGLLLALAVRRARAVAAALARESAARRRVEAAFGRHVPESVARALVEAPEAMAPTLHDATVLHLDAEGFTAFADGRPPTEVLETLDALLGAAAERIAAAGGVVVSFGGDSLLAAFGAPVAQPDHADRALGAARAILAALDGAPLGVRIGLASGPVAAGLVGGRARQAFTVYGEVVNRAQRLEQACKEAGARLLVAAETVDRLARRDGLAPLPPLILPGLAEPARAYASSSASQ